GRAAYGAPADEAARWVIEDPTFTPYRLALARALVREQQAGRALAHFDTLLARDSSMALLLEAAGAHASAGDSTADARLLGRALALAPLDASLRRSYAEALSWSGDYDAAIAQYDTLVIARADADLLIARGRLHAWRGDDTLAERDLLASAALRPDADAWGLLGDIYRWRGAPAFARAAYARANLLRPGDARAAAGMLAVTSAERKETETLLAQDGLGWSPLVSYLGDNDGFALYTAGASGCVGIGSRTALTVAADARRLAAQATGGVMVQPAIGGWSADVGVIHHA